jgi:polyprenyl P-hydroxybenzoate/phenylacrylic acid decarboxylase-like protein
LRIVLAITGASGAVYARRALALLAGEAAAGRELEVHWVASSTAPQVWATELGEDMPAQLEHLRRWDRLDFGAPFASGSNAPDAVILMPCSMANLARVAHGGGDDLIARACEVALKERKRLILVVRETPLSLVHLRNMVAVTEAGAVVLPASPSFYADPNHASGGVERAIDSVVSRALEHAGVSLELLPRWGASA